MNANDQGSHTYVRPLVVPVERTSLVRPYIVKHDRIVWLPIAGNGRKRARLPLAL